MAGVPAARIYLLEQSENLRSIAFCFKNISSWEIPSNSLHFSSITTPCSQVVINPQTKSLIFLPMEVLVRESTFGRLANYFTKDRIFPYPDFSDSSANIKSSPPESLSNKDKRRLHSVDWSGPNDPDKPMNWPTGAKFVVMIEVTALNFSFYAAAAIFTPSIPEIEEEFRVSSAAGTLGLSLFVTAYGIGPLIVGPRHLIENISLRKKCSSHHYQIFLPSDVRQSI